MRPEDAVIALFAVAAAVALVARRFRLPYTVALVVAGLALGSARLFEVPHLTKDLLYAVFLPGLLFEAAFHLEFRKFWQNKIAIVALAIPGLIVAVALTGLLLVPAVGSLGLATDFTLGEGFVFAALIAATDPIAVVALFKSVGAPKRLAVLVEGESLLNDGTAVVIFMLVSSFVMGEPTSIPHAALDFVRVVGMGVLIGAAIGYGVAFVIHQVDDPMIEITLTTVAAYGSFVAAEHFHFSGVIATVTAGMLSGNYAARSGMTASTRLAVISFWEYVAFALNSVVFLLIGFEVRIESLISAWKPIVVAYIAVTVARAAVIGIVTLVLGRTREKIPRRWSTILLWGGLRGALSMVLVLGLPPEFVHRELVVSMTFGVVILSILGQGTTMGPLLRRLGLAGAAHAHAEHDRLRGEIGASRAALGAIERMDHAKSFPDQVIDELRAYYRSKLDRANSESTALHRDDASVLEEGRITATRHVLLAEKDAIAISFRAGDIAEPAYEKLIADVDARLFALEAHEDVPQDTAAAE